MDLKSLDEKLDYFKMEIANTILENDLRDRVYKLGRIADNIEKYLLEDLVASDPENRIIQVWIGDLHYVKKEYIIEYGRTYIKDQEKRIKDYKQRIEEIDWRLKRRLDVIKPNVVDGTIILKNS